jgi:hypothetical protein
VLSSVSTNILSFYTRTVQFYMKRKKVDVEDAILTFILHDSDVL